MMEKQINRSQLAQIALVLPAVLFLLLAQNSAAQFPVKIPKIKIPTARTTPIPQTDEKAAKNEQRQQQPTSESSANSSPRADTAAETSGAEFRVGDEVEIYCDCFGGMAWTPAKIEAIEGGHYRVRYGSGRYQTKPVSIGGKGLIRDPKKAAKEAKMGELRGAFLEEARPFYQSVRSLMSVHSADLREGNNIYMPPTEAGEWTKIRADLESLDKLCTGKYAGLTNPESTFNDISRMPATWCEIAARRAEYEKLGKSQALARNFEKMSSIFIIKEIDETLKDRWGYVPDKLQKAIFEREAWRRETLADWRAKYAETGAEMPADLLAPVEKKIDELKAYVDKTAPTRKWEQPAYKDAAAEAQVRGRIAAEMKGAQILKIGTSYNGWRMHKNSLGIPTNQYKRGWVLLKVPNRPFCESREWLMQQEYAGGGRWKPTVYKGLGSAILMPCQQ